MANIELSTQPYKGTRDFYPREMTLRNWFFGKIRERLRLCCFEEYGGPMLESLDIYIAKSGEELAGEQTYNFEDRGGRRLAVRPEMTPTVARMVAGKLGELSFPLRWFSIPNLYRYERPQRGRLREHWQVNVDIFGADGFEADAEVIATAVSLLDALGAKKDMYRVHINNRRFFNDVICSLCGTDAEGAKKIFCMKNLFEFFKNIVKVTFLGYLIYKIVANSVPVLLPMCYGTLDDVFPALRTILKNLAVYTVFGYVVIAIVDRLFQQRNFLKQMMMTKDEVKREYKEMEGSQEVKQAQRQFRNEILQGEPPAQAVKKADVVVTNPTHLAVGIRYRPDEAPLPKVVCRGQDVVAKEIREAALREGIPLMENVPLARALYAKVKIEEFIPVELVEPVAEVLKWVKALNEAKKEDEELDAIELT